MGINDGYFIVGKFFEKLRDFFFTAEIFFIAFIPFKPAVISEPAVSDPDGIVFEVRKWFFTARLPQPIAKGRYAEDDCQCGCYTQSTFTEFFQSC